MQAADMSWMMLDRFVFRRDDDDGSFPDEAAAPMRARSSTSLGDPFAVALLVAAPPAVSRLYVRWPLPGPLAPEDKVTEVLAAHRRLFLLRITSLYMVDKVPYRQDYFVFKAGSGRNNSWLQRLPPCTEPIVLSLHGKDTSVDRLFDADTIGLVGDSSDQYAVVQLAKFFEISQSTRKMGAELCVLSCSEGVFVEGICNWKVLRLPIQHSEEEFSDLQGWSTDATITFNNSICWVDYHHGGILSYIPAPLAEGGLGVGENIISYIRLPIKNRPNNSLPSRYPLEMYRSLCVTSEQGKEHLRFIDVAREDDAFFGLIRDGCSFIITCYTSTPTSHQKWRTVVTIRSEELWHPKSHKSPIPQNAAPMFPVVNRDKPTLLHFLMSEPSNNIDKVSMVEIDIIKKKAVSVYTFIEGEKDLCGKYADMGSIVYEVQDC